MNDVSLPFIETIHIKINKTWVYDGDLGNTLVSAPGYPLIMIGGNVNDGTDILSVGMEISYSDD